MTKSNSEPVASWLFNQKAECLISCFSKPRFHDGKFISWAIASFNPIFSYNIDIWMFVDGWKFELSLPKIGVIDQKHNAGLVFW